jgi:hypothetical protein
VQTVDGDRLVIDALREAAGKARVDWSVVLRTDATPHNGDWAKLMLLVGRTMPRVEQQLSSGSTLLLVHPGLLAPHDRLDLLERLRDRVGRPGGPKGLWLLLPAQQPQICGGGAPSESRPACPRPGGLADERPPWRQVFNLPCPTGGRIIVAASFQLALPHRGPDNRGGKFSTCPAPPGAG